MGFNFPNSPVEGATYFAPNGLAYVFSAGAWRGYQTVAYSAPIITSDVAPVNAMPGMLWWNSANGALYVYYDDGDSRQWVQTAPIIDSSP